ncbi:MAG: phosphoribosylformylglycinamidine cyclo-ligase [Polyangiaceae bacterium]
MAITYRDAGVDIDRAGDLVSRIAKLAKPTRTPHVLADIGGFAGLCALPSGLVDPILVSGTDGVGTKLKVAFATGKHDTIGIDLVAMCVNDVVTCGATPLFFLDYFGTGKLEVDVGEAVIRGIAEGCKQAGCALLGGETAELPGMYADGEYDLAGFSVGVVEKAKILDGKRAAAGDSVIGVASTGLHSNGYSLARRVVDGLGLGFDAPFPGDTRSVAEVLLTPTRIYANTVKRLVDALGEKLVAIAHITGGGLPENLPRVLPHGLGARLDLGSYERPNVFRVIAERGPVEEKEMRKTFNLGVGLSVVVKQGSEAEAIAALEAAGDKAWKLGSIEANASTKDVDRVTFAGE